MLIANLEAQCMHNGNTEQYYRWKFWEIPESKILNTGLGEDQQLYLLKTFLREATLMM